MMQTTVETWDEFRQHWDGVHNFILSGGWTPFSFEMPCVEAVINEIRRDSDARIWRGAKGDSLDKIDIADSFRQLPIEETLTAQFQMSHFKLQNFSAKGQLFYGFQEQVMQPWQQALTNAGFTWTHCYPILFMSGPVCATKYHMDYSHVLAWQRYGSKRFVGLKEPERWSPLEARIDRAGIQKPSEISEQDELSSLMQPDDVLWNAFLTPHWVEASESVAYSINISHGGLRLHGKLCRHEQEIEDWRAEYPDEQNI